MRAVVIGSVLATLALLVGIGSYVVGKNSGEDLDAARAAGRTIGTLRGSQRGVELGYAAGREKGRSAGYAASFPLAYRRAYRAAFSASDLTLPANREIEVRSP